MLWETPQSTQQRGNQHSQYAGGGHGGAPAIGKSAVGPGKVPSKEPPGTFLVKAEQAKDSRQKC